MPLFFILTGVVSASSYGKMSFKEFTKRKFKSLMIPYILFAVFLLTYKLFRDFLNGDIDMNEYTIINTILITRRSYVSGLWFLPCLFIAHCVMFWVMKFKKSGIRLAIELAFLCV